MINEKNILNRIRAAEESPPPAGAYAVEIPSNQYVVGNLTSQMKYTQTREEDNGNGNMGTHSVGQMDKTASNNRYLEKIAKYTGIRDWGRALIKNVKEAEPLTQLGIATGALVGAGKATSLYDNAMKHKHHATYEEKSLKTLQSINRNLNKAVVKPVVL